MKFSFKWSFKDFFFSRDKGSVFSCFACGGGSTMGYLLNGYDVIGHMDIDPKMVEVYRKNHKPKHSYCESIQTFKLRDDLPDEMYNLDILDGSPPCSSFSTGGNREKDWGKEKKFKEGQAKQVLDTLFFDFIELADKYKPKVCVAENVEGLMLGKAKAYVRKIYDEFDKAGYYCQHWLLDGSKMGLPQERKRVFFVALRKDLAIQFLDSKDLFTIVPKLDLEFNFPVINFSEIEQQDNNREPLSDAYMKYYEKANYRGVYDERSRGGIKFGYFRKAMRNRPLATIMSGNTFTIQEKPELLNTTEFQLASSFPLDYDFLGIEPQYIMGMSVPPIMMAQVVNRIHEQWLSKL